MPPVQFAVQSYQARSLKLSAQRCVNYFAEMAPPDAKSPVVVYNAPGTKAFGSAGLVGAVRGAKGMQGVLYIVAGNTVYSIDSAGVATSLGTINTFTGNVSMAVNSANPPELIIVDGTDGWTYDTTNGLVQITDVDFKPADTVTFLDGYFVLNRAGTGEFFISGLNDGQSYSATDFATAEGNPDDLVAVFADHGEMWAFGVETTEIYYNSGDPDFPLERITGARIERGCAAAFSIAEDDNTLFWLGDDGIVYRADGWRPVRISQHGVEQVIADCSCWDDAFAFFITIEGHKFYHLTFPTDGVTFVYDAATGLWHERESRDQRYWRGNAYARIYNKHIVGDAFVGRLGELDMDTFTEYGEVMPGLLTGPPIHMDRRRVFHTKFELDIESGVGTTTGSEPQLWMDYSDDGGNTWSARKPFFSMGALGERQTRIRWNRLGQARERVYRVQVADAVKRAIVGAHWDGGPGTH